MKKSVLTALALFVSSVCALAQAENYAPGKVALCPVFDSSFSGFPQEASDLMLNKLTQIVAKNGIGSFSEQYVLTAKIAVEDKQVTQTAPPQYMNKLSVQLQVVDIEAKVLVGELTLPVAGVDKTESRSYLAAIRQINPSSPKIKAFIENACAEIIAAYNRNMEANLQKARNLAANGKYDDALAGLAMIPEGTDSYAEVKALSGKIYNSMQVANQAKAAASAEADQREKDRQLQQQMMESMKKKEQEAEKGKMVKKVKSWFLGSLS